MICKVYMDINDIGFDKKESAERISILLFLKEFMRTLSESTSDSKV